MGKERRVEERRKNTKLNSEGQKRERKEIRYKEIERNGNERRGEKKKFSGMERKEEGRIMI